ncbi:APOBEC1 complementation factor [Drosophila ficusphila]|uniref:APOBEC1 complementation factor n=1 Tax=Drosophila ficusphila TaxID=30025 RepID=UPI0007E5CD8C|nr:APOBEC1 complementation factor [Drosophila ficusphila]
MDFDACYNKAQINGTINITTRRQLEEDLKNSLEEGAGELFLTCIPKYCTPEWIVQIASELGEVYSLRFKIDFSGYCRGYAYLQYVDELLKEAAIEYLPKRFLEMMFFIRVLPSSNNRELVLHRVESLSPWQVYQEMRKIYPFVVLRVYQRKVNEFIYIFGYRNNDSAANAHLSIRNAIKKFGPRAGVSWMSRRHFLSGIRSKSYCCLKLDKGNLELTPATETACFEF